MTETLTILSWNVQGERIKNRDHLSRQIDFIADHVDAPTVVLLQAVNCEDRDHENWPDRLEFLRGKFSSIGLDHLVHTGDWARELDQSSVQPHQDISHNRCQLTASSLPLKRRKLSINTGYYEHRPLKHFATVFPEKLLVTRLDLNQAGSTPLPTPLEIWNVGVIYGSGPWGEEKLNLLETIGGRLDVLTSRTDGHFIVGGDFNAPREERSEADMDYHGENKPGYTTTSFYGAPLFLETDDGEYEPWTFNQRWKRAERRIFSPGVDIGLRDAYWIAEESKRLQSTVDYSHVVPSGSPSKKRLDHVLVSDNLDVTACTYLQQALDAGLSDHAPVVAHIAR